MAKTSIDILQALRLARRLAHAVASQMTTWAEIDAMTDAEILKQYDEDAFAALEAKQQEAEELAGIGGIVFTG